MRPDELPRSTFQSHRLPDEWRARAESRIGRARYYGWRGRPGGARVSRTPRLGRVCSVGSRDAHGRARRGEEAEGVPLHAARRQLRGRRQRDAGDVPAAGCSRRRCPCAKRPAASTAPFGIFRRLLDSRVIRGDNKTFCEADMVPWVGIRDDPQAPIPREEYIPGDARLPSLRKTRANTPDGNRRCADTPPRLWVVCRYT